MATKLPNQLYLELAQRKGIDPNFYLSESYLRFCGAETVEENGWLYVISDGWLVFPPLYKGSMDSVWMKADFLQHHSTLRVWSDFSTIPPFQSEFNKAFLDYEYIFDPMAFNDLTGGSWEVYRKNVRKWPKRHENWTYKTDCDKSSVDNLLADWLEQRQKTVQDIAVILSFVRKSCPGVVRKFLYDEDDRLHAINVWDENYKYINYRFCIVQPQDPFVDEFARFLFYTDPEIQGKGKLVNDGGCLDSMGLEHFKDKLHPVRKRPVYSWELNK